MGLYMPLQVVEAHAGAGQHVVISTSRAGTGWYIFYVQPTVYRLTFTGFMGKCPVHP